MLTCSKLGTSLILPEEHGSACSFSHDHNLACLPSEGSYKQITQLNQPVVVEIKDDQNNSWHAVLEAIDDHQIAIKLLDQSQVITTSAFLKSWNGKYIRLWRTPPTYIKELKQGMTHPSVDWLGTQLALLEGERKPPNNEYFGAQLYQKVIAFQHRQGLIADGTVDALTWIRINDLINTPRPQLKRFFLNGVTASSRKANDHLISRNKPYVVCIRCIS